MSDQPPVVPNNTLRIVIIVIVAGIALTVCAALCVVLSSAGLLMWNTGG
jgi:hypothetical protein